jgi:chloramphenicol-sensitive protein RarD
MKKGILFAIGAYLIWGFMPVYLKSIQGVPALQILGHRITWSFILLAIIILILHQGKVLLRSAASLRILGVYSLAAILLAANWLTYIWAVNSGQVIESSLGYFINPLVSVLFGLIFFK